MGSLFLLQGIFPTQELNSGLPHCRKILYQLSHKGSSRMLGWVACPFSSGFSWSRNWTGVFCIAGRFFTNWAIREALQFSSVQFSRSVTSDSLQPHERRASLSLTISWSWLKLMSIESVMPFSHLIRCNPLLLLPTVFPGIRVFSNEATLHIRWPKYWGFSISPSSEYSGLISFRMHWFDLLAVQGTLTSLLQHHSWKASILQCSACFIV